MLAFFNARFDSDISLVGCHFYDSCVFQYSAKNKLEDDDARKLIKTINMSESYFYGELSFDNREFKGSTDFRECVFSYAPTFYGCELHQETFFPSFGNFLDTASKESFLAYRVLKLSMENVRNRLDEGAFFALEQRSMRMNSGFVGRYLSLSFLYDLASIYGLSVSRPLVLLFVVSFCFLLLYVFSFGIDFFASLEFVVQQILKPYSSWVHKEASNIERVFGPQNLLVVKLIAALHSTLSLILLALSFLAARWRFKKG